MTTHPRSAFISATAGEGGPHARTYDVIDADGHVLEPIDIRDKYIEPRFCERAPRMIADRPELSVATKRQILAGGAMGFYKLTT